MDTILEIPIRIIKEQELVIGPLAWDEAKKVSGLNVLSSDGVKQGAIDFAKLLKRKQNVDLKFYPGGHCENIDFNRVFKFLDN
jgi:hypothetical protein